MDYEDTRFYLFTQSFVASKLSSYIKTKYSIPDNISNVEWLKFLVVKFWDVIEKYCFSHGIKIKNSSSLGTLIWAISDEVENIAIPEFKKVSNHLEINNHLFKIYTIYWNVPKKLTGPKKIYQAFSWKSITDEGLYIKVDIKTTDREIKRLLKDAKTRILNFEEAIDRPFFPKTFLNKYNKKRKDVAKDDNWKVKIYMAVEKEIKEMDRANNSTNGCKQKYSDYPNELTRGAIEHVTGELLSNKERTDKEFDKLFIKGKKRIQTYYYEIARRYALPTQKKYKSIFRVMTP